MPNDSRRIGFAASSHPELFPSPRLSTYFARPFPRDLLRPRAHPLSLPPLQSAFASSPRSSPFGASFTCLGFRPSSRHHPCAATQPRKLPRSRFVPSSGFRNLSTFCSALGLADLFHPAATSRVLPVQGLLFPRSHPSSSEGACPLAVAPPRAHRLSPAAARVGPRLRGLHPRETAFDTAQLFTTLHVAPLFGFVSSRLALHSVERSLPALAALDVLLAAPSLSRSCFELVLSVSPERSPASRLRFARLLELSSLPPTLRARDPDSPPVALRRLGSGVFACPRGCPREQLHSRARVNPVARTFARVPPAASPCSIRTR